MTCKVPILYITSKICSKDIIWTFYNKDVIWTSYINYADFRDVQNMLLIYPQYKQYVTALDKHSRVLLLVSKKLHRIE